MADLPTPSDAKLLLDAAVEFARTGDVRGFLINLHASHVLDGVIQSVHRAWPGVDPSLVESVVGQAPDALYEAIQRGKEPRKAAGFLWGVANNRLKKLHDAGLAVGEQFDYGNPEHNTADPDDDGWPEGARDEAIRFARSILPRLGQDSVLRVMSFIIECAERGEPYVDNATIAEAVGLSVNTAKVSKHRGFRRLEAEARKAGMRLGLLEDAAAEAQEELK